MILFVLAQLHGWIKPWWAKQRLLKKLWYILETHCLRYLCSMAHRSLDSGVGSGVRWHRRAAVLASIYLSIYFL